MCFPVKNTSKHRKYVKTVTSLTNNVSKNQIIIKWKSPIKINNTRKQSYKISSVVEFKNNTYLRFIWEEGNTDFLASPY